MKPLTPYEQNSLAALGKSIEAGKWSNAGLIGLLKTCEAYLNLESVAEYATRKGITTQAARQSTRERQAISIRGVGYVVDNF